LAKAVTTAPAGADVLVHTGTYPSLGTGSRTTAITFRSAPNEPTATIGAIAAGQVNGFTMRDLNLTGGASLRLTSNVVFEDDDISSKGILGGGVNGLTVQNNHFHDLNFSGTWSSVTDAAGHGVRLGSTK